MSYTFGSLAVKVTATGTKVPGVTMATQNYGGNPISATIEGGAIPTLEQRAVAAQSANIQTVSGATYTSQAFITSLQSALSQLGI